jgi:hypothetical protein
MSTLPQAIATPAIGLISHPALIAGEDPAQYAAHIAEYKSQHKPITIDEQFLVKQMADATWRLNRTQRLETPLFNNAPGRTPFADPVFSNELLKLTRYQKSLESTYFRASRELRTIRKEQTDAVKKEEKQEVAAAIAENKQKVAEFSAALDEIMYGPLPGEPDTLKIAPTGRKTEQSQSEPGRAAGRK